MATELTPDQVREPNWFEKAVESFIHLPTENLKEWKGIDMEGVSSYEEWWVCVNNLGLENPKKDVDTCVKPGTFNTYSLSCDTVFNATLNDWVAVCEYCVTLHDAKEDEEPMCTTPCNYTQSYINEFSQEVYDVRCIDPYYQLALDNAYVPTAPPALRIVFQIIAFFFQLHVIALVIAPWYLILLVYMFLDFLLDWIWYGIFFAWCLPCAWVFIWIFNIAFLPFTIWAFWQNFQLSLLGFVFDGFLLFFNGDGCFMHWGNNCWFAVKPEHEDNMTYLDSIVLSSMDTFGGFLSQGIDWASSQMVPPT